MASTDWAAVLAADQRNLLVAPGCNEPARQRAEAVLRVGLPVELASFLMFSNGLIDASDEHEVVWPLERLVAENVRAWKGPDLPLPAALLGFGDDGAGDWFCVTPRGSDRSIKHWNWIDGAARPVADDLPSFLRRWLDGHLTV